MNESDDILLLLLPPTSLIDHLDKYFEKRKGEVPPQYLRWLERVKKAHGKRNHLNTWSSEAEQEIARIISEI